MKKLMNVILLNGASLFQISVYAACCGMDPEQVIQLYDGSPIPVNSGEAVAPVTSVGLHTYSFANVPDYIRRRSKEPYTMMMWQYFYPFYSGKPIPWTAEYEEEKPWTGGKEGWNGNPVVMHKGHKITIDKPGNWYFTDIGVFFLNQTVRQPNEIAAGVLKRLP